MKKYLISDFINGWFVGNFEPSLHKNENFEVCLKRYLAKESEPIHFQKIATEITVIIEGICRIGNIRFERNEICVISPNEPADFEAITDVTILALKFPSIPSDKFLGNPNE